MANYTPPNIGSLPFTFSTNGYSKPEFNNISFNFSLVESTTISTLQASIEVMQLYQDTTYTYLKECRTIIIGYDSYGVQTLKLPCSYGGVRDIGGSIVTALPHKDLNASIYVLIDYLNLAGFIRRVDPGTAFMPARLTGTISTYSNLIATMTGDYINIDLSAVIDIISVYNLNADILPNLLYGSDNLSSYLKINIRNNIELNSYLNIIEIKNLPVDIIPSLLNSLSNITSTIIVYATEFKNLNAFFQGWDIKYLSASIDQVYFSNLKGRILSTLDFDLTAYVYPIDPLNLKCNLHGFDSRDLLAYVSGVYGPNDLVTYLNVVDPKNLLAKIDVFKGINNTKDLFSKLTSLYENNLYAYLNAGGSYNLASSIIASGSTLDLYSYLFPKVIHIKKVFAISLLTTKNLFAVINSSCFNTYYKNLGTNLYSYDNKNLNAYIMVGFNLGGNLPAKINNYSILTMDTVDIKFLPDKKYSSIYMDVASAATGRAFDTIETIYSGVYKGAKSLNTYLNGTKYIQSQKDLITSLTVSIDDPFLTTISNNRFKVLDLAYNSVRNWKREVELLFNSQAKQYRYVVANKRAYRELRTKHWIISVIGFDYVPDIGIERGKVRKKYIFDLSKYRDVDGAIRDAIDRISVFRKSNLTSYIKGVISLYNYKELNTYIFSRYTSKGTLSIPVRIKGMSDIINFNLTSSLTGLLPLVNLSANIVSEYYNPELGNSVDFNFIEEGKVDNLERDVDLNFIKGI